ncbi:unnamed protein product, partial [Effrenium voratum]
RRAQLVDVPRAAVQLPDSLSEIEEDLALQAAERYQAVPLELPAWVSEQPVTAAFLGPARPSLEKTPLLLLHGFDSSALEFRRLLPRLERLGFEVYLLDLLGWGFGGKEGVKDFSPKAKREHIFAFWSQHLGSRPAVLGGGSLGGGIAMDFAVAHPQAVEKLILLNPQGFIDGAPKVGPLGFLGIKVLGSWPLRWMANQMGYFDKETYATEDAVRVGRLHVDVDGWEEASLDYLNSGGYTLSPLVSQVSVPTLMLWGEKDEILNVEEQVPRFQAELSCPVQLQWIKDSGHVPHLEKPEETAAAIAEFLQGKQ